MTITLRGGLDTVSAKTDCDPGTLWECQNFDVGILNGYSRIDGFSRVDGRVIPSISKITFRLYGDSTTFNGIAWHVGDTVSWPAPIDLLPGEVPHRGVIAEMGVDTTYSDPTWRFIVVIRTFTGLVNRDCSRIYNATTSVTQQLDEFFNVGYSGTTQSSQNAILYTSFTDYLDRVTPIPGGDLTKIPGTFFFRDTTYAVADLVRINFIDGSGVAATFYGAPLEGSNVYNDANAVCGVLVELKTTSGSWSFASANAAGYFLMRPNGVTLPTGNIRFGSAAGQAASFDSYSAVTKATLWQATYNGSGGWSAVTMPRRIGFKQTSTCSASAFFLAYARRGLSVDLTAPTDTGFAFANVATDTGTAWSNVNNVKADDGNYATCPVSNQRSMTTEIQTTDFMVSAVTLATLIPPDAVILGVEVVIERWLDPTGITTEVGYDHIVSLLGLTGPVENKADTATPYVTIAGVTGAKTYGGPTDKWSNALSTDEVRTTGFGVRYVGKILLPTATNMVLNVDYIKVKVYYQRQTTKCYIRNTTNAAPSDIEVTVVHRVVDSGDPAGDDPTTTTTQNVGAAVGEIFVTGLGTDAAKTRLIGIGEEIRTATAGGGSLIAVTTSTDTPLTLPSAYDLEQLGTRYVSEVATPYAGDNSEVVFVANGADRAFLFDGQVIAPIGTGIARNFERPTFLTYWSTAAAKQLVLGYATGTVIFSEYSQPLAFVSTASGFADYDASGAITGLQALQGGPLMIATADHVDLKYSADDIKTLIPNGGVIPYTLCNMGKPMYADHMGFNTLSNVLEFGNFALGTLSDPANADLLPRLQSEPQPFVTAAGQQLIAAIPVRNKNQYRAFFEDGTVYTVSLRPGQPAQITRQFWHLDDSTVGMPVLALCFGTTSNGKDVQFFTRDTAGSRYVYQMDVARTFDGNAIDAYITLNPAAEGSRINSKKFDRTMVFGAVTGYCTLTVTRNVNYRLPSGDGYTLVIGDQDIGTIPAVTGLVPSTGIVDLSTDGRDISIKFAHSSTTEGPFVLQSIENRIQDHEDPKR